MKHSQKSHLFYIYRFSASDKKNASSGDVSVKVVICSGCANNGECKFDEGAQITPPIPAGENDTTIRWATCDCEKGWEGL